MPPSALHAAQEPAVEMRLEEAKEIFRRMRPGQGHLAPEALRAVRSLQTTATIDAAGLSFHDLADKAGELMAKLSLRQETVAVAETSSGGLISASLLASPFGGRGGYRTRV